MSNSDRLLVEVDGDILRLTINRPEKRNALSMGLLDELGAALQTHHDTQVKCVLLTGAGDRAFAAGGDLK
jgi:enoyl-CoA hydratase